MTAPASLARPDVAVRAFVQPVMGMPVSIHVRAHDPRSARIEAAVESAYATLRQVDRMLSPWRADSDLLQIRHGTLDPAAAHPWLAEVEGLCRRATDVTGGLFTSTLNGPDGSTGFDPTGLSKGWAVELAAHRLRALPGVSFCINAGGDLLCGNGAGEPPDDNVWRVGLQDPRRPGQVARVVTVGEGAVATSGSAARGAHVVDPRTGAPIEYPGSATVTGPSLLWCDVWATAAYVDPDTARARMPCEDGYRLIVL